MRFKIIEQISPPNKAVNYLIWSKKKRDYCLFQIYYLSVNLKSYSFFRLKKKEFSQKPV